LFIGEGLLERDKFDHFHWKLLKSILFCKINSIYQTWFYTYYFINAGNMKATHPQIENVGDYKGELMKLEIGPGED